MQVGFPCVKPRRREKVMRLNYSVIKIVFREIKTFMKA